MRTIKVVIIGVLRYVLEQFIEKMGIVKFGVSVNPWMSGEKGRIGNLIFYERRGELCTRSRPQSFNRKNPASWKGRNNRFKEFMKLSKCYKFNLTELYETIEPKLTFFNMLTKQLNKFWVGGPAPAPYAFSPGVVEVAIGNGSMPDARDVSFTPSAGLHLGIAWDTSLTYSNEHDDDVLQVMIVKSDGTNGIWMPSVDTPPVQRGAGTATVAVPKDLAEGASTEVYCAIKFKAGSLSGGKGTGTFKFPVGIVAITLIP